MKHLHCIILIFAVLGLSAECFGSSADSVARQPHKIGLVLSGGGAKGVAHIGVIQALEDAGIPVCLRNVSGGDAAIREDSGLQPLGYRHH